jgi:hypothetical protein
MEVMVESLHHVIDQLAGVFVTLLGEVKIEHGGFELGMAHVTLDDAQVNSGFEEMGGVAMPQRIIILLTNSLPRRSVTDIILFMEQKSKWCAPCAASTKRAL